MAQPLTLSSSARRALDRMAGDLVRVLGDRFVALAATGSLSSVVFAETLAAGDLEAFGALVETWHKDGLHTPLLLTPEEFRRSLDTFPLEYQTIVDRHVVIAGTPPFQDIVVPVDDLRRACEMQAKGHLIHLRQGWIEAAGHDDRLAMLIARSAAPLRALLEGVAGLSGAVGTDEHPAAAGARIAGLPDRLIRDVLALEAAPDHAIRLVRQLPDYLAASERLWAFVDGWRSDQR